MAGIDFAGRLFDARTRMVDFATFSMDFMGFAHNEIVSVKGVGRRLIRYFRIGIGWLKTLTFSKIIENK